MKYPTLEQVERATVLQLATWRRFLGSPGIAAIMAGKTGAGAEAARLRELEVLERIIARHEEQGGWTPALSKEVGLDPPG